MVKADFLCIKRSQTGLCWAPGQPEMGGPPAADPHNVHSGIPGRVVVRSVWGSLVKLTKPQTLRSGSDKMKQDMTSIET